MDEFETENYEIKVLDNNDVILTYKPTNMSCNINLQDGTIMVTNEHCINTMYIEFEVTK